MERSDECTEGILDTLSDGLFQNSIKKMDDRFNLLLGNFIAGRLSTSKLISCPPSAQMGGDLKGRHSKTDKAQWE